MNGKLCLLLVLLCFYLHFQISDLTLFPFLFLQISLAWSMASGKSEWEQSSTTRSISSALALDDGYLLLFTSDGFVVSSDVSTWCRSDVCPVVAEEVKVGEKEEKMHQQKKKATGNDQQQQPNITALSDLWNGTRVLGLKRVDASALLQSVAFKSTVVDYLLLIQQVWAGTRAQFDML